jgi:phytoene dehydrogenase-like protein
VSDAVRRSTDDAPDAVVIGAGHNGLVAANLLADAGWEVVICEATDSVGGAVRSGQVTAPGFQSDLFSAFYPFGAGSPVLNSLDLRDDGLRWSHAPSVLAHVLPDDRCAVLSRDRHQSAASVAAFADSDAQAWLELTDQWEVIGDLVTQALFTPFPPVRSTLALLRALGAGPALRLARMAALPVRRFGDETFAGAGGPLLFAGNALHADLSPDSPGSALYGWLLTMLGQQVGFPVPVGGAGELSGAMARRFTRRGGVVRLGVPVERVTLDAGVATGVVLASGERIRARRSVLADVDAPTLFGDLVGHDHLPPRFVRDLANFQWDLPTLKIDWALSAPVPWTASGAVGAGTVHLGVDMNGLTDYAADLVTSRIPKAPLVLFGQMTTADPSRSPAGTESAWGYTHLPSGGDRLDEDQLQAHVDRVEAVIERHAPGFGNLILSRHVQTPVSLQQADANLKHGAINAGTTQLHQQLVFRPVPGLGGAATPIDRLFLAGASAHPGGGVHGGPGANAAAAALARAGISGRARWAATRAMMRRIYRPDPDWSSGLGM